MNYRADRKLRDVRCAWCGGVVDRPSWIRSPRVGCCREHEQLLRRLDSAKQKLLKAAAEFHNIAALMPDKQDERIDALETRVAE
jgi:hypothetical protein